MAALFKENLGVRDEVRVNLRSQGNVDVNKIAAYFGGGGHKTASGATVHDKIDRVRNKVLAKIAEEMRIVAIDSIVKQERVKAKALKPGKDFSRYIKKITK